MPRPFLLLSSLHNPLADIMMPSKSSKQKSMEESAEPRSMNQTQHSPGKPSRGWRIVSKFKGKNYHPKAGSSGPKHAISFDLPYPYPPDSVLNVRFPQENERAVAKLVRDLSAVLGHHVNNSIFLKGVVDLNLCSARSSITYCPDNPDQCIDEFTKTLSFFKSQPGDETSKWNDGSITVEGGNGNGDFGDGEATSDENGVPALAGGGQNEVAEDGVPGFAGHADEYPTPEQHSHLPWPACVGTTGFRSLLCKTCATFRPPMWKHQLEMADFCISPRTKAITDSVETLYDDGWILSRINCEDFSSFEANKVIAAPVISAWGRLLNRNWNITKTPSVCLHILNMDDESIETDQVLDIWHCWLVACRVDFLSAKLVYIPYRECGLYGLLIVNFIDNRFQLVYCGRQDFGEVPLDIIVQKIGSFFWNFLLRIGDSRNVSVQDFPYEVITPHWCLAPTDDDSGLVAMHVMEVYSGITHELLNVPLHQDDFRLRKRVSICSRIASGKLNLLRPKVIQGLATNICTKVGMYATPDI